MREKLNAALKKNWQEWEIPRAVAPGFSPARAALKGGATLPASARVRVAVPLAGWPEAAKKLHSDWWEARISRQKEIDAAIAAKAEYEYLYDKPYEDNKTVRVAGPFTVESLLPHRVLGVDENDELIDSLADSKLGYNAGQDFVQMILENFKTAGVQQSHKEDKITFTSLAPWPGELVCAEGRYLEGETGKARRHLYRPRVRHGLAPRPGVPPPAKPATRDLTRSSPARSITMPIPPNSTNWAAFPCSRPA